MTEPTPPPATEPPTEAAAEPSLERFERMHYHQLEAEALRLRTACQELTTRVPDIRNKGDVDWVSSELHIRVGKLIDHLLPPESRVRLLYDCDVLDDFLTRGLLLEAKRAEAIAGHEANQRRSALLQGVGLPVPPGALPSHMEMRPR